MRGRIELKQRMSKRPIVDALDQASRLLYLIKVACGYVYVLERVSTRLSFSAKHLLKLDREQRIHRGEPGGMSRCLIISHPYLANIFAQMCGRFHWIATSMPMPGIGWYTISGPKAAIFPNRGSF